jgi:D-alanine--poly(phosphoribitol) ligase subunit 2
MGERQHLDLAWHHFVKATDIMATSTDVLNILEQITGTDQVRLNPDLALFDLDILDSLGTVELIVALTEKFGVEISPAEIERQQWASPRKIIAYMEERVGP